MPRTGFGELRVHLRTLQCLGVLRFDIDFDKCLVRIEASEQRRTRWFLAGVTVFSCSLIIYSCWYPEHFIMGKHNNTGNCYALINFRSCALTTLLVYIQLYARRCRFAKLLQSMMNLNQICINDNGISSFGFPYILHLVLFVICMLNYAHGYWVAGVSWITIPIYLLQYGFSYLILGQLVVLFACFQRILLSTLRHYNRTLLNNLKLGGMESGKLYENFRDYNQLLWLSHEEINQCFGLLLLPITGFALLITPSGPFFLVSTIFEGRFRQAWRFVFMSLTASFWSVPWVTLLVLMMGTTNVQQEVSNRTIGSFESALSYHNH
ncbi:gustatory and pheromone receptor 39a-like [Drosophila serrata]|uniref:gustatory and pheromone receptor 39a-like n=1 Tax=Drosophila serrata TaxID=7274 RepID=UPI000A1D1384|nr:gustatory and pheromone receptor 39a-like [Drosophila serrata]